MEKEFLQKVPSSKKTKEWHQHWCDRKIAFSRLSGQTRMSRSDQVKCYRLMAGLIDWDDFRLVTDPYGVKDEIGEMPARVRTFGFLSTKVETLMGEEMSRPWEFKITAISDDIYNTLEEQSKQSAEEMVLEMLKNIFNGEVPIKDIEQVSQQAIQASDTGEDWKEKLPDSVQRWLTQSQSSREEELLNKLLKFVKIKLNLQDIFSQGFYHGLVGSEEIYQVTTRNDFPYVRVVDPTNFDYLRPADSQFISDCEECFEHRVMSKAEILDEFGPYLSKEDYNTILSDSWTGQFTSIPAWMENPDAYLQSNMATMTTSDTYDWRKIQVWNTVWKSWKKIWYITIETEDGVREDVVSEFARKEDYPPNTKWVEGWIPEIRKCTRIGGDIYCNWGLVESSSAYTDYSVRTRMPYCGCIYAHPNQKPRSFALRLKAFEYHAMLIMFKIEKVLVTMKGTKLVMDIAKIPRSMGMNNDQWLYNMEAHDIIWINSAETIDLGEGVAGASNANVGGGNGTQASPVRAENMSSNQLQQLFNALREIELKADQLSSVNALRAGQQLQGDRTAAEVSTSVSGSIAGTAHIFRWHQKAKKDLLEVLLEHVKTHFNNKKVNERFMSDGNMIELKYEAYCLTNITTNIYLTDDVFETNKIKQMLAIAEGSVRQGNLTPEEYAHILNSNSMAEITSRLTFYANKRNAQAQQSKQQEQQAAFQQQKHIEDREDARQERDLQARLIMKAMEVTRNTSPENTDDDNSNVIRLVDTFMNSKKLKNENERHLLDSALKQKEINLKEKDMLLKDKQFTREQDQQDQQHKDNLRVAKQKK